MRKLQLVAAAAMLVMGSSAAIAQGAGGGGGGQGRGGQGGAQQMQMLMTGITLSAEQQTRVDTIVKKYADMGAALRADQTMDQQARRAKMMENTTKRNDEIKAVLTDEQKKVFEKNVADMMARMQQMQRPPQE